VRRGAAWCLAAVVLQRGAEVSAKGMAGGVDFEDEADNMPFHYPGEIARLAGGFKQNWDQTSCI